MYAEIIAAFAGCAAGAFGGHWFTTRSLTAYFDELESRLQPVTHEIRADVSAAEHKICDFCKRTVAVYEEVKGKIKCPNCKAEGK